MFEKIKEFITRKKAYSFFEFAKLGTGRLNWDSVKYLKAYESSLYVYACVKKRAEKVGQTDFVLFKGDNQIERHPILDLIYRPNPYQTKNEFLEMYQTYKDLTGSAFIYLIRVGQGRVAEMYVLRPDYITVKIGKATGLVEAYEYRVPNGSAPIIIAPEDMIASHYGNPLDQVRGLSPLRAGALSVDVEEQLSTYHYKVLQNGGKVEGIIHFNTETLTESQVEDVKRQFKKQYSGADNAGKPLVLYNSSKYENLGLTPTELSYIESKKMTRDDILLLYGVPKVIVAQTDDVNYANAKEGKAVFLSETIKPLIENLVTRLDEFLVPEPFVLDFVDPTPEDVDLKIKKVESGLKNSYMTINEARDLMGLDAVDNGDVILVPFSITPLETVVEPQEVEPPVAADPADDPAMDDDPNMDDNMDDKKDDKTKAKKKPAKKQVKKKINHPLQNPELRKQYYGEWLTKANRREKKFITYLKAYFRNQEARMIEHLDSGVKGIADDMFNMTKETRIAIDLFLPLLNSYAEEAGKDALKLTGSDKPYKLGSLISSSLEKRANLFAEEINRTTFSKLKREVAASLDAGESRQDLIKRIENTYDGFTKGRANVIARTEVLVASQEGAFSGYLQGNVDLKIWVSTPDDRTRDSHASIDGEERPLRSPFSNGLMFPGDPAGSAEEVINCRCTI